MFKKLIFLGLIRLSDQYKSYNIYKAFYELYVGRIYFSHIRNLLCSFLRYKKLQKFEHSTVF